MLKKLLFLAAALLLAAPALAGEIRLSVAASMTDAVKELGAAYSAAHPGVKILPNFGSSGALAKQIAQGAPADVFISANPKWVQYLVEEGQIAAAQVGNLAYNSLVFVGRPELQASSLDDLPRLQRIAIGSPGSVPAGQYAEQALKGAGLYEKLAGKLVMAQDVRQALVYAERGETDSAIVYKTDALLAREAKILFEVPPNLYDQVTYPMALTVEGTKNLDAAAFVEFLKGATARGVLEKYGFVVK